MRGSALGVGTDIGEHLFCRIWVIGVLTSCLLGGSIRVPSGFSGVYGLKPSIARLPHGGLAGVHGGMENILGVVGPMATCSEDLKLFCKVRSPFT